MNDYVRWSYHAEDVSIHGLNKFEPKSDISRVLCVMQLVSQDATRVDDFVKCEKKYPWYVWSVALDIRWLNYKLFCYRLATSFFSDYHWHLRERSNDDYHNIEFYF